jgi:hypothetical protein
LTTNSLGTHGSETVNSFSISISLLESLVTGSTSAAITGAVLTSVTTRSAESVTAIARKAREVHCRRITREKLLPITS